MDIKRPYKISLLSVLAVCIALGAYFTGFAKGAPTEGQVPKEVEPTYFDKLPPHIHFTEAITHPTEFGITAEEVAKIKAEAKPALEELFAWQRANWRIRLDRAKLAEDGKFLPSSGRANVGGLADLRESEGLQEPLRLAELKLAMAVYNVIGKEKNARIVAKFDHYVESMSDRYNTLLDYSTTNAIGMSTAQKNQLSLITAYIAQGIMHESASRPYILDEVAPKLEEYRKTALSASRDEKDFYYRTAASILSPMQEFRLDTIYRNRFYVRP
jgi:hypothetical protein